MIVKYNNMAWELTKVSRTEYMIANAKDGGFYQDITDDVDSHTLFDAVFWGQRDTLFCMSVGVHYDLIYYTGTLKLYAKETL